MLKRRPPLIVGIAAAAVGVALTTLLGLRAQGRRARALARASSTCWSCSVVATVWGVWLALATARRQRAGLQLLPHPADRALHDRQRARTGSRWRSSSSRPPGASSLAQVARKRALEADERRQEADLSAEMARLLLRGGRLRGDAAVASARGSRRRSGWPAPRSSCARSTRASAASSSPLREGTRQIGTLVLPAGAPEAVLRRVQVRSRRRWRRCWRRRWSATRCRPRWSRPPRCAAAT